MIDGVEFHTDEESLKTYGKDWTKHFNPNPTGIAFAKTTEQVQKLVQWARKTRTALVPSGGRTGLSAAAFATNKEVVVSFEKMNQILSFDSVGQIVHCQAGVITETLQKYAWDKGLYYPVDFAARGSSQIGGNVATNAGGIKVIRYGLTRNWVMGLTVVTGRGEILKLNRSLVKNATGYDLRHLFIGSEGTLGLVTEVSIQLTKQPKDPIVIVMGVNDLSAIMNVFAEIKKNFSVLAYEMFTDLALKYTTAQGIPKPFDTECKYYVLTEVERDSADIDEKLGQQLEKLFESGLVHDATIGQSPKQNADLWRLREDITEATSHKKPYKNDVSVTVANVPEFLTSMSNVLKHEHPDFEVVWFGHIGDGNLHINILKPDDLSSEEFVSRCKKVDHVMFQMIEKFEGSISAEHGVGLVKKPFLHHTRSPEEIQLMKGIKYVFDPDGILNPGKIFDMN